MILQVSVIVILLITAFIDYDKSEKARQRRIHVMTNVTTALITFLTITEGLISGLEVHGINRQGDTVDGVYKQPVSLVNDTVTIN